MEKLGSLSYQTQRVVPSTFDDTLSHYEVLAKITNLLNRLLTNNDVIVDEVVEMQTFMNQYFADLDVTQELNAKIDRMKNEGIIEEILNDNILHKINTQVDTIYVENQKKANLTDIARLASATPLFANSTNLMVDNTRPYVNTSNGQIYIYQNGGWVSTGVQYQATQLAERSITNDKLVETLSILPNKESDIQAWSNGYFTFTVGQTSTGSYSDVLEGYRKDTNELIPVPPGATLYFHGVENSIFKIAVGGFDRNKLAVVDSGYITGSVYTLPSNVEFVRFVVARKDGVNFNLSNMLPLDLDVRIDINKTSLNYKPTVVPVDLLTKEWEQKTYGWGATVASTFAETRISHAPIDITNIQTIYYKVPTGFTMSLLTAQSNQAPIKTHTLTGEGFIAVAIREALLYVTLARSTNTLNITGTDVNHIDVQLSTQRIQAKPIVKDNMVDVLPRDPHVWTNELYTFVQGAESQTASLVRGSAYRKDLRTPIAVTGGSWLVFDAPLYTSWRLAVYEYDKDMKCVRSHDRGKSRIKLADNTKFVRFLVTKDDYSLFTVFDVKDIDVRVAVSSDVQARPNEVLTPSKNLLSYEPKFWKRKVLSLNTTPFTWTRDNVHMTSQRIDVTGLSHLNYKVPNGYSLRFLAMGANESFRHASDFFTGSGTYYLSAFDTHVYVVIKRTSGSNLGSFVTVLRGTVVSTGSTDFTPTVKHENQEILDWLSNVMFIGHAGTSVLTDENTIEAMTLAKSNGCDTLEVDTHMTSDGVVILMHDETLDRTTNGSGAVSSKTYAEIQALRTKSGFVIPTLKEVLLYSKRLNMKVIVECSRDTAVASGLADGVLKVIRDCAMEEHVVISSFFNDVLEYLRGKSHVKLMRNFLESSSTFHDLFYADIFELGNCALGAYYNNCSQSRVSYTLSMGIPVIAWTVNTQSIADNLMSYGVSGVVSDIKLNTFS